MKIKRTTPQKSSEKSAHKAVASFIRQQYPNVFFMSDASGLRVGMGIRLQLKDTRSKHKQVDMYILEPRGGYHGLILELKRLGETVYLKDGTLSKDEHIREQAETLEKLSELGYFTAFAIGALNAIDIIREYMELKKV